MTKTDDSPTAEVIACEICIKEIPKSEAKVAEASEYVYYFCGSDCYAKWSKENEKEDQR